jgi:type III secretory pathway component EscT
VPTPAALEPGLLSELLAVLSHSGVDAPAWLLASARLIPSVLLIPAFGLRALPILAQVSFAFILAGSVLPSFAPLAASDRPWLLLLVGELLRGLPVALGAATTIWAATMAGNLMDELRGAAPDPGLAVTDSPASPLGILLSLAACVAFLQFGGPARVTEALAAPATLTPNDVRAVVRGLVAGVQLAVLIAAPLLVMSLLLEVFHALLARTTSAALWGAVFAPLRALSLLAIAALLLDRLVEGLALWLHATLPPS